MAQTSVCVCLFLHTEVRATITDERPTSDNQDIRNSANLVVEDPRSTLVDDVLDHAGVDPELPHT